MAVSSGEGKTAGRPIRRGANRRGSVRASRVCSSTSGPRRCPKTSDTAVRRPARRPGSPTGSSTTGRAPSWCSRRIRAAHGSGSQRLYSFRDILVLKVVKRLLDTGVSLQQIRTAVQHLRDRGVADLAQITLMSDGVSVYECTSADEVIDLLQGGQGVFGIALGRVWREVEGTLAELPGERRSRTRRRADHPDDELARGDGRAAPGSIERPGPSATRLARTELYAVPCTRPTTSCGRDRGDPAAAPKEQRSPESLRQPYRVGEATLESGCARRAHLTEGAKPRSGDEALRCR